MKQAKSSIKLSDKQKKVIQHMREGVELYIWYGRLKIQHLLGGGSVVLLPTIKSLTDNGLIEYDNGRKDNFKTYYKLTDLGKSIEL